ncbi:hypothetical protein [Corynebacterium sanguinis]|uniref:Uncharacterized protein n=1 Tax=Corynebacterium sanguinis TaxID=2594913 RepID=A0A6C1TZ64_9CORY|nr:hypothetical protein [Corynebacterium sanguinis]TVS29792.1 hypothetical protein EKI59_02405 [Corynebacterium sanguinis]
MARLISDGGTMTVGRRTASYTWGQFQVTLQEGLEQAKNLADRMADGYVYRPDDAGRGRAELTFVRADAKIDMNAEKSDLEATLDGASRRTEGDVFYSREISGLGLARTTPGEDYDVGDVVDVLVWGRVLRLPVTGISVAVSPDDPRGVRVQVGNQMLRDAEALRKRNSALDVQIAAEKRQRLKEAGAIRATAESARVETQAIRDTLAGVDAQEPDLLDQLQDVNQQLQTLGQDPQPSLMLAFVAMSTALWTEQRRIDALQDSLIRELQESVAAAKQESADLAQRRAETVLASAGGSSHPDFPVVNAGTSWSLGGSLSAGDAVRVTRWVRGENGELLNPSSWQSIISGTGPVPGTAGLGSDVFIEVARMSTPLVVRRFSWTLPSQVTATQEYYSIPGMSVRVDKSTGLFDVSARVRWVSGWGWYSMQIVRSDGTVLADRRDEGRSNIFVRYPLEQQLTVRGASIPAGQSVFVRVLPGSHRNIGSASWAGSWTEKK